MDSSLLQAVAMPSEVAAKPGADMASVPSDTNKLRPLPGSGLPNSESGWPGLLGFSLEAAALLIFSIALMLAPWAIGAFIPIALLIALMGYYFALMGMKPTRRHRNFALLACVFWVAIRAALGGLALVGLVVIGIFF